MPEGDTVWNHAQQLEKALAGKVLTGSDFRVPQLATVDLTGVTITESACYGKHLLLRLGNGLTLHSHLRMDGTWRTYSPGQRWNARPPHTIRVVLKAGELSAVGYHLHELSLVRTRDETRLIGHLGPDLLGANWDAQEAVRRLRENGTVTIAQALLDQRNLAGIGNLYKAETLFLHRTSPWTPVNEVDDLPGLVDLSQRLLAANKGRWAQSTTGSLRPGEANWVYGRRGLCRKCGTPVRHTDLGERVTYWCPTCQPETRSRG
jgi:endonuclease-8